MSGADSGSGIFRALLLAAAGALVVLLVLGGVESTRDLDAARERQALLDQRLRETRQRIDALERRIERLQDDPATLERLARDQLGLVKPGEVVVLMRPPVDAAATDPLTADPAPPSAPAGAVP